MASSRVLNCGCDQAIGRGPDLHSAFNTETLSGINELLQAIGPHIAHT
jgi:hypothetical protein